MLKRADNRVVLEFLALEIVYSVVVLLPAERVDVQCGVDCTGGWRCMRGIGSVRSREVYVYAWGTSAVLACVPPLHVFANEEALTADLQFALWL